jgi:hypothetical protein
MSNPTFPSDFFSDHIPVCFPFSPDPSSSGIGRVRFAFLVRLEAQDPTMWFQGARACTAGTFHHRHTTFLKTFDVNGNDPEKRAFGRCACLPRFFHRFSCFCRVLLLAYLPIICQLIWLIPNFGETMNACFEQIEKK